MEDTALQTKTLPGYRPKEPNALVTFSGAEVYNNAQPFPHIIIDNFLTTVDACEASLCFPAADDTKWINYIHVNEKKYGLNKREAIPPTLLNIIDSLQTNEFLRMLSGVSGIPSLVADELLVGGGLHQVYPGGFLNVHSDFLIHPVNLDLKRRINLILFLSSDWKEPYGGNLEFWNKDMTACITSIQPLFNRCVIFNTDEYSYHGCPDVIKGPARFSRKTLALYYYTTYTEKPSKQYTDYKPRPSDKRNTRMAIYLDSKAVAIYSWLKKKLKVNDDFISQLLGRFKR